MTRRWRLTIQAESSLFEISRWTIETFGANQAQLYTQDLIASCQAVADGYAIVNNCKARFDADLSDELMFTRSGLHIVVFTQIDETIVIVDFLHARSDLPKRLGDIGGRHED